MDAALADIRAKVPGAQVTGIVTDVGKQEAAADAVDAARKALGPIDVLVNLAGMRSYEPLAEAKRRDLGAHPRGQSDELRVVHAGRDRRPARASAAASSTFPRRMASIRAPAWGSTT